MLNHQTADRLRAMKLPAMATEYIRQAESPNMDTLSFDERLGLMADAEWLARNDCRIRRLIQEARLRISSASFADVDYRPSRKLDRAYMARLSDFSWVREARNLIITGCTGTGKTWLACAFGAEACRKGLRVAYYRVNRLLEHMAAMAAAGDTAKLLARLRRMDMLILDDWGLATFSPLEGRFLLEVFEDRYQEASTIIAAQSPVSNWHALFEDSTIADAVLDRVVHSAHRFELQGPSLRRESSNGAQVSQDQDRSGNADSSSSFGGTEEVVSM